MCFLNTIIETSHLPPEYGLGRLCRRCLLRGHLCHLLRGRLLGRVPLLCDRLGGRSFRGSLHSKWGDWDHEFTQTFDDLVFSLQPLAACAAASFRSAFWQPLTQIRNGSSGVRRPAYFQSCDSQLIHVLRLLQSRLGGHLVGGSLNLKQVHRCPQTIGPQ
jgi:hypothetical protein